MTAKAAHPSSVERDGSRRQLMDDSTLEFDQWQVSWLRIVSARIRCPHTLVRRILFLLLLLSSSVPGRDICARRANSTSSLSFLPPFERKEGERERERELLGGRKILKGFLEKMTVGCTVGAVLPSVQGLPSVAARSDCNCLFLYT